MFKSSIRWKFILVYFLLVFVAMIIVGVFITKQFESYYLNRSTLELKAISQNSIKGFLPENNIYENREKIQTNLSKIPLQIGYEAFIIDPNRDYKIIASTNSSFINKSAIKNLNEIAILKSANNQIFEDDITDRKDNNIRVKHMAIPYLNKSDEVIGIIYTKANLTDIYSILESSRAIFLKGTLVALFITIILGFVMSTSITRPINEVTKIAEKMAKGDFDQRVDVNSNDEIGQLADMFNILTSKLKLTLDEISSEKEKLDVIISNMADGLIAVDDDSNIIHYNPSFLRMLNLKEEHMKLDYDKLMLKFSDKLTYKSVKELKSHKGSGIIEFKSGKALKATYTTLRRGEKEASGLVLVLQDITENRRLELMRREFVANVSHELKTPITTIKSYTETLLDGALEEEELAKNFLNVINGESDRMARLVRDLLQLSHMDNKKLDWKFEKVNLHHIVMDVLKKLDLKIKEKNQQLEYEYTKKMVYVNGDKDKLEQVVLNLVTNAIKYTPKNGEINLKLYTKNSKGIFLVKDNGMGIPKESLGRIFERFYRVDKARSRDLGGTGLGLSIVKHIIDEHKGKIAVRSKVSQGSEFKIFLPTI